MTYLNVLGVPHAYRLTPQTKTTSATLVFIHGWLLSQCYWQPVIEHLAIDFQCLSYDLRGFGQSNQALESRSPIALQSSAGSSNSPHPYSLEAYAEDLGELLAALELTTPVWLVGHSLGGSIALWAAKLFPQQVQGVICVNAGGGVYLPDEFARFRQAGEQIVRWRPSWMQHLPFINWAFTRMMVHEPLAIAWGQKRVTDLLAAHAEAAKGVLLESTTEAEVHQLPQVVANLQQPTYFLAGAEDTVMEVKYVKHLASFHPLFESLEGNVQILPECGHMAMVEQPIALANHIQERVAAMIARPEPSSQVHDSALK
ncbi:MAG: alpha/beta hydrolase [Leptolyngbya sp. SIOISBB]|nr:alpha/beta hydrolase [Leptolyngbya sp. SIOISBB]